MNVVLLRVTCVLTNKLNSLKKKIIEQQSCWLLSYSALVFAYEVKEYVGVFIKQAYKKAAYNPSNVATLPLPTSALLLPSFSLPSLHLVSCASLSRHPILELAGDSSVSSCVTGTALYSPFGSFLQSWSYIITPACASRNFGYFPRRIQTWVDSIF
jgi:hypothetical protein